VHTRLREYFTIRRLEQAPHILAANFESSPGNADVVTKAGLVAQRAKAEGDWRAEPLPPVPNNSH